MKINQELYYFILKLKLQIKFNCGLLLLLLFPSIFYAQAENINASQAKAIYTEASENFYNLENKISIQKTEKVLIYALQNEDKNLASKAYNLLGLNFEQFSDNKRAIDYYEKGVKLATEVKNDTVLGWLYNNLGGIYAFNEIDANKSNEYFLKAHTATKNIKNSPDFLVATLSLGANLIEEDKFIEGKKYLDQIRNKVESCNENDIKLAMYTSYANYYDLYLNDFNKAEKEYLTAITIGEKETAKDIKLNVLEIYTGLSELYEKHKIYDKSLFYLKKHDKLQDELNDDKKEAILLGEDKSIKINEITKRIEQVEKQNKYYLKLLKYNKFFIIFLAIVALTFLMLIYYLHKNYTKNKIINKKLKKANIELHRAKQKTIEAAKLKSQFMSTVSHELRTPLYGVIGLTEIIESEHVQLKDSIYIKSLKFSAKHLLTLINDILNLSKIESGTITLFPENVNLKEEIETIINSIQVIANQNNNNIQLDYDDLIPEIISIDKTRLSQIIINLLSNSLKFTKNGIITIKVHLNDQNNSLYFEIKDTGIGIPKEFINKVFEKFMQIDRSIDDQFQGTGLGLSIVKRFIDLFGGTIEIKSIENIGTTVSFSIPLLKSNQNKEFFKNDDFAIDLKDASILVVEDNKINQIVTQKLLLKNNINCTIANNGYHALEILETQTFDLILMDIHMPGINGFETAKQIANKGISIPIIALTASDKYELEHDIAKYNMKDILVKPFNYNDLESLLQKYIIAIPV